MSNLNCAAKQTLENFKIGRQFPPFVVAELSGNHGQSLEIALKIIDAAAAAGVNAVKLQTYTADTLTIKSDRPDFRIGDSFDQWKNQTLHDLYNKAYTPWEWHEELLKRCKEKNIIGFSTPFDSSAVDFLEKFDVPLYKIASFESNDLELVRKVASTGKPVIISTGLSTIADLHDTVKAARDAGCEQLVLLKCTSAYPASTSGSNLLTLPHMRELFDCEVGISDHTLGIGASITSVALGGVMIEKHLKLDESQEGVDAAFSMTPEQMQLLVQESKAAWQSLGRVFYGISAQEKESQKFRRSLYFVKNIKKGEEFTRENLRCIRPGFGLAPKYLDKLLGHTAKSDIEAGTAAAWDHLL